MIKTIIKGFGEEKDKKVVSMVNEKDYEEAEDYIREKVLKEYLARIKEIKKSLRILFNRFSKIFKKYRKEYSNKNIAST